MEQVQKILEIVRKILLWSTSIILILIIAASIILTYNLATTSYPTPPDLSNTQVDTAKLQVANYKALIETLQFKQTNVYDFVVLKTLLEIFKSIVATLITYVFTQVGLQLYQNYRDERNRNLSK